jgi:hypothetical protein
VRSIRTGSGSAVLAAAFVLFPAALVAQESPAELKLEDVLAMVRERNPRLLALRSAASAAEYREPEASTLPDPMVQLGVMNLCKWFPFPGSSP